MDRAPKKNLTAKIFALVLAIVLWLYVMNEQNPFIESYVEVPLEVRNLSSSLTAMDVPDQIRVKVRGPRSSILVLANQDIKAFIDAKGLEEGRNTVKIHVALPSGLEATETNPDKITLRIEAIISRRVPVEVRVSGTPPDGVVVGSYSAGLAHITIEGPRNLVETVEKAVAQVDVSGKSSDFSVMAPLALVDENGKEVDGVFLNNTQTNVAVSMVQGTVKKMVDVKVNLAGELVKGTTIKQVTATPLQVEISGKQPVIEKIDTVFTEPVNLTGIDKDTNIEAKLQTREGIVLGRKTVTVHISVAKEQQPLKTSE